MTPSEREQRTLDRLSEWSTRNEWAERVARIKTRQLLPGYAEVPVEQPAERTKVAA